MEIEYWNNETSSLKLRNTTVYQSYFLRIIGIRNDFIDPIK